jgi:hypothetical protein
MLGAWSRSNTLPVCFHTILIILSWPGWVAVSRSLAVDRGDHSSPLSLPFGGNPLHCHHHCAPLSPFSKFQFHSPALPAISPSLFACSETRSKATATASRTGLPLVWISVCGLRDRFLALEVAFFCRVCNVDYFRHCPWSLAWRGMHGVVRHFERFGSAIQWLDYSVSILCTLFQHVLYTALHWSS